MNKLSTYTFEYSERCNMCDSASDTHKKLGNRLNASQGISPNKKRGISVSVLKCPDCGLIYSYPQPVPANLQDHYGLMPESYWTSSYFDEDKNILGNLVAKLDRFLGGNERKALDIGAGLGKKMIALKNAGYDTYGIEPSKQFYDFALDKMDIPQEKLQSVMIEDADFPDEYFDFITFGAVLEHLYDPSKALKKALKWLKPGGVIYVQVPSSSWLVGKLINTVYKARFSGYVSNLSPMHVPYHLYEFGLKSFERHAARNGYKVVDCEYAVCNTMLPKSLDFILKPIMRKTNTGMEIYVLLQKDKN